MKSNSKKVLALFLVAAMTFSLAACGGKKKDDDNKEQGGAPTSSAGQQQGGGDEGNTAIVWNDPLGTYVYKTSVGAMCAYWNPHDFQTEDDGLMISDNQWLVQGLYEFIFNDALHPVEGKEAYKGYKIIPNMAASDPVDVTEKIKAERPEFNIPASATAGYAYTIDLNPNACWEDGTPINADTYVYSMQQLLAPELINYRATDYFAGDLCIAGAESYYYQGQTVMIVNSGDGDSMNFEVADMVKGADGTYTSPDGNPVFFGLDEGYAWMGGDPLSAYYGAGYIPDEGCWDVLSAAANEEGFVPVTDETMDALYVFTGSDIWGNEPREQLGYYMSEQKTYDKVSYDTVGLYKSGDYQITMVLAKSLAGFNLYYNLTSNWLVYEPYYEACKKETDGTWTTTYCTSKETTMSYGPYKIDSFQADKAVKLVRNDKWYGWTDDAHVYVDPEDGQTYRMYQTDTIDVQSVPEAATRKMMFLKGELMGYGLQSEDFDEYRNSEYAYVTPGTTIFFFIFNGYKDVLNEREAAADFDTSKYDIQTLALISFKKAVAVTYDKELLCSTINPSRSGGYGLIGTGYIYDPDTGAQYRDTPQAKRALCDFYSVNVDDYASLDDAVASITGYDPVAAKELYKQAFDEALSLGYITDNDGDGKSDQTIRIEYCIGEDSDFYTKTIDYLNKKMAEVLVGTPFEGKIEFYKSVPYGGSEWANKIKAGLSDTVLAGWSGSALNPYSITDLYVNPAYQYDAKWFDATTVELELEVNVAGIGNTPSMKTIKTNIKNWSDALNGATVKMGGGEYCFGDGIADVDTRLTILAGIETKVLQNYSYIPMIQDGSLSLFTQQLYHVIEEYNPIMGRGGMQYDKYNYTESEWKDYISSQGGELKY